jgi:hypothetical protein
MPATWMRLAVPPVVAALLLSENRDCNSRSTYWYSMPTSSALNGIQIRLLALAHSYLLVLPQVPDAIAAPMQPPNDDA